MSQIIAFAPRFGAGLTVAPGVASAASLIGLNNKNVRLTNLSATVVVYVRTGNSGLTATTADFPLLGNSSITISKPDDHDYIAYIAPAGGGSLHVIVGEGL